MGEGNWKVKVGAFIGHRWLSSCGDGGLGRLAGKSHPALPRPVGYFWFGIAQILVSLSLALHHFQSSVHYILPTPSWLSTSLWQRARRRTKSTRCTRIEQTTKPSRQAYRSEEEQPMTPDVLATSHGQGNGGVAWRETGLVVLPHFQGIGLGTKVPEIVAARCGALGLQANAKTHHPSTWRVAVLAFTLVTLGTNGVALCGNPAACILARWERGAGGDPEGVKKRWARTDFRDCGAGDLPRDVRTVRKVSKERFWRMWSSRPSHWDWGKIDSIGAADNSNPLQIFISQIPMYLHQDFYLFSAMESIWPGSHVLSLVFCISVIDSVDSWIIYSGNYL